ncbi:MAG: KH domain-containing protein [bacterium]
MKDFVEYVAKHLVDKPEDVALEIEEKEGKTIFKLKVAENDVGKLIGRKGRTASAFRVLLRAVAAKEGKRAVLDIIG